MQAPNDAPVKTMTEYHQRYSKGRLIHLGWGVYCRHCDRHTNQGALTYLGAEQAVLDRGWTLEDHELEDHEDDGPKWWHCPNCRSLFPEEASC